MKPERLYESPYVDQGHVDVVFPNDFMVIVDILRTSTLTLSRAEPPERSWAHAAISWRQRGR